MDTHSLSRNGDRTRLAVVLAAALVLGTACTGSPEPPDAAASATAPVAVTASSPGTDAEGASPSTAAPGDADGAADTQPAGLPIRGLYGFEKFRPSVNGSSMTFSTADSCTDVIRLVGAGQWSADVLLTPDDIPEQLHDLMSWFYVAMRSEAEHAFMKLTAGEYGCDGRITPASHESLTLAGAESASGTAVFQPIQCDPAMMIPGAMQVAGVYDLGDDRHAFVSLDMPAETGQHTLEFSSDPVISMVRGERGGIGAYADAMLAELSAETGEAKAAPQGEYALSSDDGAAATVDIISVYPLRGTFTISNATDEYGARLDATGSFYCDTTPLPESASSGDAADDESDGDGDNDAAALGSVTVDVTGGPRAGTHTAAGPVTCEYGLSTPHAWWVFFSPDSADDDSEAAPDPESIRMLMLWSTPADEAGAPLALYDVPFLLSVGFGNFAVDISRQLHVGGSDGGSGGAVTRDGSTISTSGTTADGVTINVTVTCPEVTEN